ncbi:hypothetical protein NL337_26950, partial [Klebsiella pneumoniae]|nr:hypothetical protein [Klebsiella pneumoniae]
YSGLYEGSRVVLALDLPDFTVARDMFDKNALKFSPIRQRGLVDLGALGAAVGLCLLVEFIDRRHVLRLDPPETVVVPVP